MEMLTNLQVPENVVAELSKIVDYAYEEESQDFEQQKEEKGGFVVSHIFDSIQRVSDFVDNPGEGASTDTMKAIEALVDYLYEAEAEDFESYHPSDVPESHVFTSLQVVGDWLQSIKDGKGESVSSARGSYLVKRGQTQIVSVEQLQTLLADGQSREFVVTLEGGAVSRKLLGQGDKEGSIYVLNMIDDTEQELMPNELYTQSNIGKAIDSGAFYLEQ